MIPVVSIVTQPTVPEALTVSTIEPSYRRHSSISNDALTLDRTETSYRRRKYISNEALNLDTIKPSRRRSITKCKSKD